MTRIISRQQLFELIWERAVSKVAPELGMSDVALRKQCRKHGIPMPDAVYWGRRHAGRPITRPPLPPAPEGQSETIVMRGGTTPAPQAVKEAVAAATHPSALLPLSEKLHPLVGKTMSLAKKSKTDERGVISHLGPEAFRLRVPPDSLERVGKLLNAIVRNAIARGHRFTAGKDGIDLVVADERIDFIIVQPMRQSRHFETEEERRRVERWDTRNRGRWDNWESRPTIPRYDYTPSGGLSFEIGGWSRYPGAQHRFVDTRSTKLEDRVADILIAFAAWAAATKVARAEAEERHRQFVLAQQRREEAARQARLEEQRVAYLERKLTQQAERDRLAMFVEEVKASAPPETEEFNGFLIWCQKRLADLEQAVAPKTIAGEIRSNEAFTCLDPNSGDPRSSPPPAADEASRE